MLRLLFLILFSFSLVFAQSPFFNEPRISGTPLLPSIESTRKYFENLKKTAPEEYQKLTNFRKTNFVIGDERDFNVRNLKKDKYEKKTFVLKRSEVSVNIWVEKNELENSHATETVISNILNGLIVNSPAESYDPQKGIFEIDVSIYGAPPDKDGNGKVDFLLTDIIDDWDGSGSYVGGFFSPYDQTDSPGSNRADILYIDTYPGIYFEGSDEHYNITNALGTVSHELQHLIQYANDPNEEEWVNEGLSELSSFLCGYKLRSPDLYLRNSDLQLTGWDGDNSLEHYSKVALWTYFLYEKYGMTLIKEISRNGLRGIDGVNAAFNTIGSVDNFNKAMETFFKILAVNDPLAIPEFAFTSPFMQYFRVVPKFRALEYPYKKALNISPYSFQSMQYTNGDSLTVNFDPFNGIVFRNRDGFGTSEYLENISIFSYSDFEFGFSHHTQTLFFINNTSQSQIINVTSNAKTKYDITTLQYGTDEPTFLLTSLGNTNAIQYLSPRENAFIKSVEFYNSSLSLDLVIHAYDEQLEFNPQPQISLKKENVVISKWVSFDLEDYQIFANAADYYNVGIEFVGQGAMGYETLSGDSHSGKSYLKRLSDLDFKPLNTFTINDGVTLSGAWMLRLEIASPYTGPHGNNSEGKISSVNIFPNPFTADKENLIIEYTLDTISMVSLAIYNILGQLVYTYNDPSGSGLFKWNGKNNKGQDVASGIYLLSIGNKGNKTYKRVVILH